MSEKTNYWTAQDLLLRGERGDRFVLASDHARLEQECERFRALLKEIRPTIPRDVLELWCADRDAALSAKP